MAENFKSARILAKPRCRTGELHKARVICSPWKWSSHVVFWGGTWGHPDTRHSDCHVAKRHLSSELHMENESSLVLSSSNSAWCCGP